MENDSKSAYNDAVEKGKARLDELSHNPTHDRFRKTVRSTKAKLETCEACIDLVMFGRTAVGQYDANRNKWDVH